MQKIKNQSHDFFKKKVRPNDFRNKSASIRLEITQSSYFYMKVIKRLYENDI